MTEVCDISVIVPCYNANRYLNICLESLKAQRAPNIEMIFIDDGSTDATGRIADEYVAKDKRVHVIHQKNGHLSVARNVGLSVIKGDFVSFIDADDWIDREMLNSMYTTLVSNSLDLVITGVRVEYPTENRFYYQQTDTYLEAKTREEIKTLYFRLKELCLFNYAWNKLYHVSFLRVNNLSFTVEPPYEDESFNMEVFMKASSIGVLPDTPYHYMRYDNGSIVATY